MGVLLSSVLKLLWRREEFKIVLVGLDNAGKTTILYKLYVRSSTADE
jgi:ADP-ribosylation factor-like protein 5B